jgi:LemA protein
VPLLLGAGGVVLFVLLAALVSYNRFVSQRQLIDNSWSNVDTELRRRYDLIPNLVATVKGYAAHEQSTLTAVTEARAGAVAADGTAEQARAEGALVDATRQLLAVAERYPELAADTHFLELQRELVNTEDRIQAARRFFNANVRDFNRRVQSIPSNLIAALGNFEAADYFELDPIVRDADPPPTAFG